MHIPVQAGSNKVLEDMRRDYTVEDYEGLITKIKSVHPDMTIATDVICGFPGETDEEFQETIELVKRTRPDVVNISRYWERPKTRAANRDDKHPTRITKDRSRLISEVFTWEALEVNKRWKGWQGEILIDETGKDGTMVGRNYAYKPVIVEGSYPIGRRLTVKVFGVSAHDLRASVVE